MIEVIHCIIKPKLLDSHSKMSFDHFMKKKIFNEKQQCDILN